MSLRRERSLVTNNPAAEKARSASTDVGGMLSKALKRSFNLVGHFLVAMLFTSFAQNQPNACEDRTKIFCNLLCVTVLKIPGIFVRKPGKWEAKKFIKSREFPEPGSNPSAYQPRLRTERYVNGES